MNSMNPPPITGNLSALMRRLLIEMEQPDSVEWDEKETSVKASVYFDPDVFRQEQERIFRRLPLCLGHVDQLREPGSLLARTISGLPVLLARGKDGQIRAMLNVCRHRGTALIADEGEVCKKHAIACPYHTWTYDLAGKLIGVPEAQGFPGLDRGARGLRQLPVEVRDGLIWCILDPDQPGMDLSGFLGSIEEDFRMLDLGTHCFYRQQVRRSKANWKLIMNAFQEVYHLRRLHSKTLGPFFKDTKSAGDFVGPHVRFIVARAGNEALVGQPEEVWDLRRDVTLSYLIFPNTVIICHPDYTSILTIFPVAPDESLFLHTMCTPHAPRTEKEKGHWERSFNLVDGDVFFGEDLHISEQIQKGLKSGANDSLLFGRFEHQLRAFHGEIDRILRGA